MESNLHSSLSSGAYTIIAVLLGVICLFCSSIIIPKILNILTPHMNEEKEIAAGNRAVAEYHGRVVSALLIGISIIIAAAIVVGMY